MNENVTLVFHEFLNYPDPENPILVEAVNEYLDSGDREPVRAALAFVCQCCGK